MAIVTLQPIAYQVQEAFQLNSILPVITCTNFTNIVIVPMTIFMIWAIQKIELGLILRISSVISIIGAITRGSTVFNGYFWPQIVGSLLMASA